MPTKEELEQQLLERDQEIERLRGQLTTAHSAPSAARVTFPAAPNFRGGTELAEGVRQDLETNGVAGDPFTGARLYADDYGIEVKTEAGRQRLAEARRSGASRADVVVEGVTHVYPSVAPGVLAADAPVRGSVADTTRVAEPVDGE